MGGISFIGYKNLISFFSQTINVFCISFEPLCYLGFIIEQHSVWSYADSYIKKNNFQNILIQHSNIQVQHLGYNISTFCT